MTHDENLVTASYDVEASPALTAFMREGWADQLSPHAEPADVAGSVAAKRALWSDLKRLARALSNPGG